MTHTCPKCGTVFDDAIDAALAPVVAVDAPTVEAAPQEQENTGKPTLAGETK